MAPSLVRASSIRPIGVSSTTYETSLAGRTGGCTAGANSASATSGSMRFTAVPSSGSQAVADESPAHGRGRLEGGGDSGVVEVGDVLEDDRLALPLGQQRHARPQVPVRQHGLRSGRDAAGDERGHVLAGPARRARERCASMAQWWVMVKATPGGVSRGPQRRVGRQRPGPRLLRDVVAVHRSGEGMGEPGDVTPVGVDEGLEGGQRHPMERPCLLACDFAVCRTRALCRTSPACLARVRLREAHGSGRLWAVPSDGATRHTPLVIAHRGSSSAEPEHTLAAYMRAIDEGADGLGCDVRLTADSHLVCVHDRRINRTSNGRGIVSTLEARRARGVSTGSWKAVHGGDAEMPDRDRNNLLTLRRLLTVAAASEPGRWAWRSRPSTRRGTPGSSSGSWRGCWWSSAWTVPRTRTATGCG